MTIEVISDKDCLCVVEQLRTLVRDRTRNDQLATQLDTSGRALCCRRVCAAARLGILYTMRERKINVLNI